jgi:excisionase family DNA binding protein
MEYSLAEAAKAARVAKSTVLRAIKAGRISARREGDGTYRIDASELARTFDLQHLARSADHAMNHGGPSGAVHATHDPGEEPRADLVRLELRIVKEQLAREREDREQERATARETVDDLRKRLDRSEERVLALSAQPVPATPQPAQESAAVVEELRRRLEVSEARNRALMMAGPPAPPSPSDDAAQDAFFVVEELRKRRQESGAVLQTLGTSAPQAAQERPSETPAGMMRPAGFLRRFLGRLLSR